jgi:hypothetical protein
MAWNENESMDVDVDRNEMDVHDIVQVDLCLNAVWTSESGVIFVVGRHRREHFLPSFPLPCNGLVFALLFEMFLLTF